MSDFTSIRGKCLTDNVKYTDDDFPAQNSSVYYNRIDPDIVWKRPPEICDNPRFIADGASRFDLFQGKLGNCWFVAAAAVLATKPDLFEKVVPADQHFDGDKYAGIFRFNFWRYGAWSEVIIDDRLPTKDGKLIFAHNRNTPDEFWGALVEKAYAKIHGSYQALISGFANEALVDFTAGIAETASLHKLEHPYKFFRTMKRAFRRGSLLTSLIESTDSETYEAKRSNGLVVGHVYSITGLLQLKDRRGVKLLRLRNPWGRREWNGAWSDTSDEWSALDDSKKKELGLTLEDDGEFWMPFSAWVDNFNTLEMCHLNTDLVHGGKGKHTWDVACYHGEWVKGVNAGGCGAPPDEAAFFTNPQYFVRLEAEADNGDGDDMCALVVSLMQKYARAKRTRRKVDSGTDVAIGFNIYKVQGEMNMDDANNLRVESEKLQKYHLTYNYEYLREISQRFELHPGTYCVIPATFYPDKEAEFMLRIAADAPMQFKDEGEDTKPIDGPPKKKTRRFDILFKKHSGEEEAVDAKELAAILNAGIVRGNDSAISKETCRALIENVVGSKRAILDYADCKRVWKRVKELQNVFTEYDYNDSGDMNVKELRAAFESVGYTLGTRELKRIVKKYCAKRNHLNLDDFVYCVTKVASTQGKARCRHLSDNSLALRLPTFITCILFDQPSSATYPIWNS
ncbi:hypothetical protein NP493_110g00003 [Ridgeia piscesae]|uniref:Uncharacterized protein n=1 Tax=Ridgeia piscesae TaxID=27915 RepID=A0AAD9P6E3_RIDPI|nr:hypothetical protein NP493_110g00003 [Ridgeia piscesae]